MSSRSLGPRKSYNQLPFFFSLSDGVVVSRNAKRALENLVAGDVELSAEDRAEIGQLLEKYPRKGGRYVDGFSDKQLHLWN
jgi:diketogulonate reductase-like aldo/keto reductase